MSVCEGEGMVVDGALESDGTAAKRNATVRAVLANYMPHGDTSALSGPHNGKLRQRIMLAITGAKLPIAQCGVNALQAAALRYAGISATAGTCSRDRDRLLAAWIRSNTGA